MSQDGPGRRTIRVGLAIMLLGVLVAVAAGVWWAFLGEDGSDAEVFEMPGSVAKELTEGEWALYTEDVGGSQKIAYADDIAVQGPGDVGVREAFGFYGDQSQVEVDGTTYDVFVRLTVPEPGTYEVTITGDSGEATPVVLGPYTGSDGRGLLAGLGVLLAVLVGGLGFLVVVVGLLLRLRGRRSPG